MVASRARGELAKAAVVAFVLGVALSLAALGVAQRADAITLSQPEAPMLLLRADPHEGYGVGVVDADTQGQTKVEGSNNIVLLVAALGVLIGVLIVARPRRGPKS